MLVLPAAITLSHFLHEAISSSEQGPMVFSALQKMKSFKDVATMWCFIICLLFYIVFFIIFLSLKSKTVPSLDDLELVPWRRKWQPTPVFLPGESQGQRSLVGCRLWGRTESDTTEVT